MAGKKKSTPPKLPGLDKLYFGKDDAETDIAKGGLLKQGFMRTHAYDEALAGNKTLIVGRKGSGKSAICLMLKNALSSEKCALVTPDEISADEIRRFHLPGIPPEQSKKLIWRYVFAVQIAKFILAYGKRLGNDAVPTAADELSAIRRFLLDNGEVDDVSFTERFWRIVEKLKGAISVEAFSVKVSVERPAEAPSQGARTNDRLDLVEARLESAARKLSIDSSDTAFHLLIDQLEKVWSNDRESDSMVVGLLLAAKETRERFQFLTVTVFLRTDIYEQLQFQDRDKFRGDEFRIDWDESRLLDLILARAQASAGEEVTRDILFGHLFPSSVDGQSTAKFLVSRTLMRPRDIIQLCNACRDTARTNGHASVAETDIQQAIGLYSNWKLSDLQNEWTINYPFLADAFVLLANSSYLLHRDSFEATLGQVQLDLASRYPSLSHTFSTDTLLSILYAIGLLGVVRNGQTFYSFHANAERQIKANDREFVLHPCFRSALQSTSALKLSAYQPYQGDERGLMLRRQVALDAPQFWGPIRTRATRSVRFLGYTGRSLDSLRAAVEKSSLPEELRAEIRSSLTIVRQELSSALERSDPLVIADVGSRVHRHLSQVLKRLHEGNWFQQDKDLEYIFQESLEELERFVYRGEIQEYLR